MSEFSLINLVGISVLWVALFVLGLLISFMISFHSIWEKLKHKFELHVFFVAFMLGWDLYFTVAFISELSMLWPSGSVSLYWGLPNCRSFLSLSTMLLSSTRVIISLETTLFGNRGFTALQNFLLSHKFLSSRFPKYSLLLLQKSVTYKFLRFGWLFQFSWVLFFRKTFPNLDLSIWQGLIHKRWLITSYILFFSMAPTKIVLYF